MGFRTQTASGSDLGYVWGLIRNLNVLESTANVKSSSGVLTKRVVVTWGVLPAVWQQALTLVSLGGALRPHEWGMLGAL